MKSNLRSVAFIYASKIIAFAVNSLSVIIVVPYVASVPEHYAIYMFALSLIFILTYGDLGFECSTKILCYFGCRAPDTEIKDVGYVLALLLSIGFIFLIIMVFILSIHHYSSLL